jgi:DNA-binding XRE family transcriptional regulator
MMDSRPWEKAETAKRFKALRRKSFMTQRKLGEILGICRQSISEIENAHVMPGPRTWERFVGLELKHNQPQLSFTVHWV